MSDPSTNGTGLLSVFRGHFTIATIGVENLPLSPPDRGKSYWLKGGARDVRVLSPPFAAGSL